MMFHVPCYEYKTWHATLFMWAFVAVAIFCNHFLRMITTTLETLNGICRVLFFVIVITVLTMLGERSTPEFVFGTLNKDVSGWKDPFVCWSISLLVPIVPLTAFDGVLHMSKLSASLAHCLAMITRTIMTDCTTVDETKEPRKRVPKSMKSLTIMNAILLFGFIIAVLFCIGDFVKVVEWPLPILEIYYQATKSKAVSTVLVMMHAVPRDSQLGKLADCIDIRQRANQRHVQIHPKLQIPLPALALVALCTALLALINIGSEVAFDALIGIPTCALMLSYFIPICLITIRKVPGEHPKYGPFKLGR